MRVVTETGCGCVQGEERANVNPLTHRRTRGIVLGVCIAALMCATVLVPTASTEAGWRIIPIIDDEYGLMVKVNVGYELILAPVDRMADLQAATGETPVVTTVHAAITNHPIEDGQHSVSFQDATAAGNVLNLLASRGYDNATGVTPLSGFVLATQFD